MDRLWPPYNVYNPSNLGLVVCLLIIGAAGVFPQHLWWGPPVPVDAPGAAVLAAWVVIIGRGWWVLRPMRMLAMVAAFIVPFALLVAVLAASGSCFSAIWHPWAVCGPDYWAAICGSPVLAVFALFMMSDPKTAVGRQKSVQFKPPDIRPDRRPPRTGRQMTPSVLGTWVRRGLARRRLRWVDPWKRSPPSSGA